MNNRLSSMDKDIQEIKELLSDIKKILNKLLKAFSGEQV